MPEPPATERAARLDGFEPVSWLRGGHLETIVPGIWVSPGVPGDFEREVIRVSPEGAGHGERQGAGGRQCPGAQGLQHQVNGGAAFTTIVVTAFAHDSRRGTARCYLAQCARDRGFL